MTPRRRRVDEALRLLQSIAIDLEPVGSLPRALEIVLRKVCRATGWALGEAWLPGSRGELIRGPVWHARDPRLRAFAHASREYRFPMGRGLPGRVWKSRAPAWVRDVRLDANFPRAALARDAGLKAGFALPLLAGREGVAVFAFYVLQRRRRDASLVRLVSAVAAQLGSIIRRRLIEHALRVSRHVLAAQEAERRRLSRELHDGVTQALSAAVFRLRAAEEAPDGPPSDPRARELVQVALRDIRRVCRNLGAGLVEDLGFPAAVRGLCRDFEDRTRTPVRLVRDRFPDRLPPEMGSSLYRIVQEGLANVERHARATRVRVRLCRVRGGLRLSVRDDGVGFSGRRRGGLGLGNVRERAGALGGAADVRSHPGRGTELVVTVPWARRGTAS